MPKLKGEAKLRGWVGRGSWVVRCGSWVVGYQIQMAEMIKSALVLVKDIISGLSQIEGMMHDASTNADQTISKLKSIYFKMVHKRKMNCFQFEKLPHQLHTCRSLQTETSWHSMPQEPDVTGNKAECTLGNSIRDSCISWSSTCQTGMLSCDSDEMMA